MYNKQKIIYFKNKIFQNFLLILNFKITVVWNNSHDFVLTLTRNDNSVNLASTSRVNTYLYSALIKSPRKIL